MWFEKMAYLTISTPRFWSEAVFKRLCLTIPHPFNQRLLHVREYSTSLITEYPLTVALFPHRIMQYESATTTFSSKSKIDYALRHEYNEPPLAWAQDLACSWSVSVRTAESCFEFHLLQSRHEAVVALRMMVRLLQMSGTIDISLTVARYCHRIIFSSCWLPFRPSSIAVREQCDMPTKKFRIERCGDDSQMLITLSLRMLSLKSRIGHTGH